MKKISNKKRVYVAMSGGVDSSVSAGLLKQEGYEVTGVFIKIWDPEISTCDWRAERRDALRVAGTLEIPLRTIDLSAEYKKAVIDYLINEYRAGRTPNPDVMCNKEIKFGAFFDWAIKQNADYVATGHYAIKKLIASSCQLLASEDKSKDQTYFLWAVKAEVLEKCLFPIGEYKKSEVRKLAKKFGLPNAEKPDSQGLCFIGEIDFKDFLAKHLPEKVGNVLNEGGEVIGEHRGTHFYTIGERHGFTITKKTPNEPILYVVAKNLERNEIIVSSSEKLEQWERGEVTLEQTNWLVPEAELLGKKVQARCRYRAPLVLAKIIRSENGDWKVVFNKPQNNLAPGQSCVLYHGHHCLGGGVIS